MRRIIASATFALCLPILIIGAIFAYLIFVVAGIFGGKTLKKARYIVHYIWSRATVFSTLSRVQVHGIGRIPRGGSVVVYSNHASFFDIPILSGFVLPDAVYIARRGLALSPVIRAAGGAIIEQRSTRRELANIRGIVSKIKAGSSFIIFPEGTRTRDGNIGALKSGSMKIAQWAGVPAVPVRIEGSLNLLPRWRIWPRSADIDVFVGEPISPDEIERDPTVSLAKLQSFFENKTNCI